MNNLLQTGVILGRITQISVDRGIVISDTDMGLADFLYLLSEEARNLPVTESLNKKLLGEITNLLHMLSGYGKGVRLEPDDARIMIGITSRWSDMLLDELTEEHDPDQNVIPAGDAGAGLENEWGKGVTKEAVPESVLKKSGATTQKEQSGAGIRKSPDPVPKNVKEKDLIS
jgi:hypothetical protein